MDSRQPAATRTVMILGTFVGVLLLLSGCFLATASAERLLTVQSDGNGATEPSGDVSVHLNDAIDVSATADTGFAFDSWSVESGSGVVIDDESMSATSVTLTGTDAAIMATFSRLEYTLTLTTIGDGTTTPAGVTTVLHGLPATISAMPGAGSVLVEWSVISGSATIGDSSAASTTATLTSGPATIRASFGVIPHLYIANYDDNSVSVIDGLDGSSITTITVGAAPAAVGVNALTGKIYVAHFDGETQVIDGSTNAVVATIPAWAFASDYPSVAVDVTTNTIFVATQYDADVEVIDGNTDTSSGTFWADYSNYNGTYPNGLAVNSATGKLYISDWGDSTLYVYDATTYAAITSLAIDPDSKGGVAVNPITNRIYAANNWSANTVSVIDGSADTEITAVGVGANPTGLAVNTVTNMVYVVNTDDGTVSVIDGASNTVTATIDVGVAPLGVAVSETFNMVYVVNSTDGTVSFIDGATNTVVDAVTVGNNPQFIGVLE